VQSKLGYNSGNFANVVLLQTKWTFTGKAAVLLAEIGKTKAENYVLHLSLAQLITQVLVLQYGCFQ